MGGNPQPWMSVGLDRGLVHPASVELTRYSWLLFVGFEPTHRHPEYVSVGKSILLDRLHGQSIVKYLIKHHWEKLTFDYQ